MKTPGGRSGGRLSRTTVEDQTPPDKETVGFDRVEEGKSYKSTTTSGGEVMRIALKGNGLVVYEECDTPSNPLEVMPEKTWNPNRWTEVEE